jgi:hypothetical protein
MPTDVDRALQQVAIEIGRAETFNKAPVGVYFGNPGVEADDRPVEVTLRRSVLVSAFGTFAESPIRPRRLRNRSDHH